MAEMKNVEMVRKRLVAGYGNEIIRFRSWLSSVEGNAELVDLLRGEDGDRLLADLVELTMAHLGHATDVPSNSPMSQVRKVITAARGAGRRRAQSATDEAVD